MQRAPYAGIRMAPPLKWKLANPYFIAVIGGAMVEIRCPHCDEDIELEDDVFGLFDCPHCDEEFSWEDDSDDRDVSNEYTTNPLKISGIKVGLGLLLVAAIVWPVGPALFNAGASTAVYDNVISFLVSFVIFSAGISVLFAAGIMKLLRG
jgi:hypothetical protein